MHVDQDYFLAKVHFDLLVKGLVSIFIAYRLLLPLCNIN